MIPAENTIIGSYKKLNGTYINIEFKYVLDPYKVYVPEKNNNNMIINMYNIGPEMTCSILYKWFKQNVSITELHKDQKCKDVFMYWISIYLKKFYPKINESNWRVEAIKLRE
jgi:hypothetical protein